MDDLWFVNFIFDSVYQNVQADYMQTTLRYLWACRQRAVLLRQRKRKLKANALYRTELKANTVN